MFTSKWKLIGFVAYLVLRLVVTHPVAVVTTIMREIVECRVEPGPVAGAGAGQVAPSRFSNASR
ncbi:MAG: hypothetical protein PVH00_00300 [Gemmatimonadota bacterium]|jgi:hypothetical protein